MNHNNREFSKGSAKISARFLCALFLLGCATSSARQSGAIFGQESVCPKSAPPAKMLWAVRMQDLEKESEERLPL
jgi:hypothetical protein